MKPPKQPHKVPDNQKPGRKDRAFCLPEQHRHCEERSDEAIQLFNFRKESWIASLRSQ
jgi:hypothetical protein